MVNPFQFIIAFHIEASHLLCSTNEMTGFYMKFDTDLNWVKERRTKLEDVVQLFKAPFKNILILCDRRLPWREMAL